ncbi:hemoglobin subunit mu-like [Saccoglossus kowalevskii]|uniref:Non-symbiotic hemoglobin 1-like n=1 Tax=Saccoglossus kowalevskii TaxID=10224 RepID=A0ABM0MDH8_SACKO|nr:PREDICTED: non-symbiotic hemoglobin 1-like [Saccoglossus kowalevskii]
MGCANSHHVQTNSSLKLQKQKTVDSAVSFTDRETAILRSTWPLLASDMTRNGGKIFLQIFAVAPHVKDLFPFRYVPNDMLQQNEIFKMHGRRFMQSVGAVIENIDNLDGDISILLHNLGKRHTDFDEVDGAYFDIYTDCMMHTWRSSLGNELFTPDVGQVWHKLFDFIINCIKDGYFLAMKNKKNNSDEVKKI